MPTIDYDKLVEALRRQAFGLDVTSGAPKKKKRKVSSWQKFVKANSNKKKFKYASGKLNLKKMGVAYRKTAVYKRNKKK